MTKITNAENRLFIIAAAFLLAAIIAAALVDGTTAPHSHDGGATYHAH